MTELLSALDEWFPQLHPVSVILTAVIVPALLRLIGFRFQWRADRREEQESAGSLMLKVAQIQRSELMRLVSESEVLNRQITMLSDGRYKLQEALDALREQTIAARVLIHDYERRLGLQETKFPSLPIPSLTDRPPA